MSAFSNTQTTMHKTPLFAAVALAAKGAKLIAAAGKADGDNAGQVTAIENMMAAGAKTILITPSDSKAIVPAIKKAQEKGVVIVSVDSGCAGIKNVKAGVIAATSQQYPLKMASMGVEAGVAFAKDGKKVKGYTDTGVTLISDKPMKGVDSKDTKVGTELCWGNK